MISKQYPPPFRPSYPPSFTNHYGYIWTPHPQIAIPSHTSISSHTNSPQIAPPNRHAWIATPELQPRVGVGLLQNPSSSLSPLCKIGITISGMIWFCLRNEFLFQVRLDYINFWYDAFMFQLFLGSILANWTYLVCL